MSIEGATYTNSVTGARYTFINGAWRVTGSVFVDEIVNRITLLEDILLTSYRTIVRGSWLRTSDEIIEANTWDFVGADLDNEGDLNKIELSTIDSDGETIDYESIAPGNLVNIKQDEANYSIYEVESIDTSKVFVSVITIAFKRVIVQEGEFTYGEVSDISIYEPNASSVGLEQVLQVGNVADKDIYLTHIAHSNSDIIDISPEKAKVIIATEGNKVPTFELQHYAVDDPSEVKLELDQDGTRFDIECDDKVNNIHFRFEDQDKFIINRDGDAQFKGRVEVEDARNLNEAVTLRQLELVQEELEQLRPTYEKGTWELNTPFDYAGSGQYAIVEKFASENDQRLICEAELQDCLAQNPGDPINASECSRGFDACIDAIDGSKTIWATEWEDAINIHVHRVDANGIRHNFVGLQGKYLDIMNKDASGYGVYEIKSIAAGNSGDYRQFIVEFKQGVGKPNGSASIQVFELNDELADFSKFVMRSGDSMEGTLDMQRNIIVNAEKAETRYIRLLSDSLMYNHYTYDEIPSTPGHITLMGNDPAYPKGIRMHYQCSEEFSNLREVKFDEVIGTGDRLKLYQGAEKYSTAYVVTPPVDTVQRIDDYWEIKFQDLGKKSIYAVDSGPDKFTEGGGAALQTQRLIKTGTPLDAGGTATRPIEIVTDSAAGLRIAASSISSNENSEVSPLIVTDWNGKTYFKVNNNGVYGQSGYLLLTTKIGDGRYLQLTGGTLTGGLQIAPTAGKIPLFLMPHSSLDGNSSILECRNSDNKKVFYVAANGNSGAYADFTPTLDQHLIVKKYLDSKLKIAFAPAKRAYYVSTDTDSQPGKNRVTVKGTSMANAEEFRIHKEDLYTGWPLKLHESRGTVIYEADKSALGDKISSVVLTAYYEEQGQWKYKGTAVIKKIEAYDPYLKVTAHSKSGWANGSFSNNNTYWFTLSGFF